MSTVSSYTRISGLASGLDTDSIVSELMKASEMKVDTVRQQKQLLEWKQEFYQEITTKLYDFQQKYCNSASSWSSDLSNLSASYNSDYISVTTSSGSVSGNIYIQDIMSVATAANLTSSSSVSADPTIAVSTANLADLAGKSIIVNIDGIDKQLTFSSKTYTSSADVQTELQSLIDGAFGSGKAAVSLSADTLSIGSTNSIVTLKAPTDGTEPTTVLTFDSYSSNRVDLNVSLSSAELKTTALSGTDIVFEINGKTFNFTSDDSLNDIMTNVNSSDAGVKMSYSSLTDKFTLTSTETGAVSDVTVSDTTGTLMNALFGAGVKTNGTDAIIKLSMNGSTAESDMITLTRSTNTFVLDGTTVTVKGEAANDAQESINISLNYNTDSVVEKITSFINDYNTLLGSITSKISEEYDSDYLPLTETQKENMSDTEIENWEKKAKTGLLSNDIYLKEIASSLRSCFFTQVSTLGDNTVALGTLSEIGISTLNYTDNGKLTIDKTKLTNALNSDPEKVMALFTQKSDKSFSLYATAESQLERFSESGVYYRLSDVLSKNLSNIGIKGALINLVGSPTDTYKGNTDYSLRISSLTEKIADMEDDLADEEDRYYKKFTAMESAIAKLNQQSSWITNMISGNS